MFDPPGNRLLPASQRALFAQHFDKDLRFFQLLLLLINKSCPLKNVDLMWRDIDGPHRAGRRFCLGTTQALGDVLSGYVRCEQTDPNPRFCSVVNDGGKRDAESCGRSDSAAMDRVGQSGGAEVYRCHAGLIDIAVPVISEGRHIATLFSGQVLNAPPSAGEFVRIQDAVRPLSYIDVKELEEAYQNVPVVSQEDIERTVGIMQIFADYVATCWARLREAVESQHSRIRTAQLHRKEFAHLLLAGDDVDLGRLRELAKNLGFAHYPNRVLVVQVQQASPGSPDVAFDLAFTQVLHAVEELTEKTAGAASAHLRGCGICVLFWDPGARSGAGGDLKVQVLAQRILSTISERCEIPVRIGIGRVKHEWRRLRESYQEAWMALAESPSPIAIRKASTPAVRELSTGLEESCRLLLERKLKEARAGLFALPVLAGRSLGDKGPGLKATRQFLASALEFVVLTAGRLGCERDATVTWRCETLEAIELSPTAFDLQEVWASFCERVLDAVGRMYAGKHQKLVDLAQQLILRKLERDHGPDAVCLADLARSVGVSPGHLSRTFKRTTGVTLERYLMVKRVERAQRLLLDPVSRVSETAERCGFCNPAYFARVFRKLTGCSPSEFSKQPNRAATA